MYTVLRVYIVNIYLDTRWSLNFICRKCYKCTKVKIFDLWLFVSSSLFSNIPRKKKKYYHHKLKQHTKLLYWYFLFHVSLCMIHQVSSAYMLFSFPCFSKAFFFSKLPCTQILYMQSRASALWAGSFFQATQRFSLNFCLSSSLLEAKLCLQESTPPPTYADRKGRYEEGKRAMQRIFIKPSNVIQF